MRICGHIVVQLVSNLYPTAPMICTCKWRVYPIPKRPSLRGAQLFIHVRCLYNYTALHLINAHVYYIIYMICNGARVLGYSVKHNQAMGYSILYIWHKTPRRLSIRWAGGAVRCRSIQSRFTVVLLKLQHNVITLSRSRATAARARGGWSLTPCVCTFIKNRVCPGYAVGCPS